jgi:hypothetical protein
MIAEKVGESLLQSGLLLVPPRRFPRKEVAEAVLLPFCSMEK